MPKCDRILLSAFIGSDNLGDEAIFLALLGKLETTLPKPRLTVISMNADKTRRLLQGRSTNGRPRASVNRRRFLPFAIPRHDVCVFGGGGIVQDESSILNLIYFLAQIQIAKLFGKVVALAFVGVGPLNSRVSRVCAKLALSNLALCVVRDQESKRLMDRLGVTGTDVICCSDIVLDLECRLRSDKSAEANGGYLLLSLRHWYSQSSTVVPASFKSGRIDAGTRMDALLRNLADELAIFLDANKEFSIVAVPCYGDRDALVHMALRNRLDRKYRERFRLHASLSDPCHYVRLAAGARCVIGMRLHSLVLASLSAAPLVALSYSSKVNAFMEQVGLAEQVIDIATEPELGGFASCLESALTNSAVMASTIEKRTRGLRKANQTALSALAKVIGGD